VTNAEKIKREVIAVHTFYDRELSEGHLRVWLELLDDFDPREIAAAIKSHVADPDAGHYCPKPADVIRQIRGNVDEAGALAWADVLTASRNGGDVHALDHHARLALQGLGGLSVVQRTDESQNAFLQKRFVDLYRAFRHRTERSHMLEHSAQRIEVRKGRT
jgi:hypothetical protein